MRFHIADRSPSLQRIVERQLRNWELQSHQRRAEASHKPFILDFVTVSRELGSRGEQLAAEVGRRLGWKVYDRELIEAMAGDEQCRRALYDTLDERQSNWIDGLLVLCAPETNARVNDYVHQLCRTVLTIAHNEHAIFVGRGAHLVLPPDVGVRVRAYAPLEDRIATLAAERGVSHDEARHEIRRLEQERQSFFRREFGVDPDSLDRFDLLLNLSRLSIEQAGGIVVAALKEKALTPIEVS